MAYRFRQKESLPRAVRRVGREELGAAVANLAAEAAVSPRAIHDTRKRIKKMRALARLIRKVLGDRFDEDNALLRDAGRELSAARDAQVLIETLDKLTSADSAAASEAAPVRQALARRLELIQRDVQLNGAREQVRRALETGLDHVNDWPVKQLGVGSMRQAIKRTYKRGRRAMAAADAARDEPTMHQWRKRAKDLWYTVRLMEYAWKPVLRGLEQELDRLADLLGEEHDLAVLTATLRDADLGVAPESTTQLNASAERRCQQLQDEAFAIGRRVYAEKPGAFADRLVAYWQVWRG